ncbi:hypothetical protein [Hespellia stercorisuis]|uniref:Uncharacterized protein n=1 Tax=Hespellia stercorisuis DSM 15480 TaxID=1121950 RepID=A0A1M6WUX1_9FIRM|nr:hypothetical protein [Hespellia stercorisuis]SHK97444.1 hypothetical protein SAMN02745243_04103 [Hespellia stercorisuis DSM 15480]
MKEKEKPIIRFYAAECMEFINYGALYENLTLEQAVDRYCKIENTSSLPGIGFVVKNDPEFLYADMNLPLYNGKEIDREYLNLIPLCRDYPLVQQAVRELEGYLPKIKEAEKERTRKWNQKIAAAKRTKKHKHMER